MNRLFLALALMIISMPVMADDKYSLITGFAYSSGKYGNAGSTNILYILATGKFEFDDLTVKLTVPYISITGPRGVAQGMGPIGPTNMGAPSGIPDWVTSLPRQATTYTLETTFHLMLSARSSLVRLM